MGAPTKEVIFALHCRLVDSERQVFRVCCELGSPWPAAGRSRPTGAVQGLDGRVAAFKNSRPYDNSCFADNTRLKANAAGLSSIRTGFTFFCNEWQKIASDGRFIATARVTADNGINE